MTQRTYPRTLRVMGNTMSSQDEAEGDPTVHIAAVVRVELYSDEGTPDDHKGPIVTLHLPADNVTMTRTHLFIRRPGVPASTYPLSAVRAYEVTIRPFPADYAELRERYPRAYEPWDAGDLAGLVHQRHTRQPIDQIAERRGRPPEHVMRKLAKFDLQDVDWSGHREAPAPVIRVLPEYRVEGRYIVSVSKDADPMDVAARHGVDPDSVLRELSSFHAELTDAEVESLSNDPEVEYISEVQTLDAD